MSFKAPPVIFTVHTHAASFRNIVTLQLDAGTETAERLAAHLDNCHEAQQKVDVGGRSTNTSSVCK